MKERISGTKDTKKKWILQSKKKMLNLKKKIPTQNIHEIWDTKRPSLRIIGIEDENGMQSKAQKIFPTKSWTKISLT